jgi:CBS domain-containing protein
MYTNVIAQKAPVADPMEVAMKVGDILRQKTARIATVRMNETVGIAAQLMRASNISALVVKDVVRTEGNTAVGMFTERDVVRAIAEHGAAGVSLKVSQLISVQQLVSCCSTDTLEQVRHLMNKNHIRHLPVITSNPMPSTGETGQPAFPRLPRNRTGYGHAKIDANEPKENICRQSGLLKECYTDGNVASVATVFGLNSTGKGAHAHH